jgi:hypothetical protein
MSQPPPRRTAIALSALVLANLVLDFVLGRGIRLWDNDDMPFVAIAVFLVAIGTLAGQTLLIAS